MSGFELSSNGSDSYLDLRNIHARHDELDRLEDEQYDWADNKPDREDFEPGPDGDIEYDSAMADWTLDDPGFDSDMADELAVLTDFLCGLPLDGTLIADHAFSDYAKSYVHDCYDFGDVPSGWIDYGAVESDVRHDFTEVELDGQTYLTHDF
jgi:hypothetical protein